MNVVLPEPDGAEDDDDLLALDLEGDVLEDVQLAEPLVDVLGVDDDVRVDAARGTADRVEEVVADGDVGMVSVAGHRAPPIPPISPWRPRPSPSIRDQKPGSSSLRSMPSAERASRSGPGSRPQIVVIAR